MSRPRRAEQPQRFRRTAKSQPRKGIRRAKTQRGGFRQTVSAALSTVAPAAGKAKAKAPGRKGALLAIMGAGGRMAAAARRRRNHKPGD